MSEPLLTYEKLSALRKAQLTLEILAAYVRVRRLIKRVELPLILERVRVARAVARSLPLSRPTDGARLGQAVGRALRPLPADTRCLTRSLVLVSLLARRGIAASLVIAVRPEDDLSLAAHAWVELDGRPVLAPAGPDHGRLVTL
jgi:hypothetical protein